jgi:hypothetical protein
MYFLKRTWRKAKMKTRTTFILFLTAIIILAAGSAFGAYSGGTGDPNNPYKISTKADLLALAADTNDYDKCFILTADINLEGQVFTTAIIAPDTSPDAGFQGTAFAGTFDGNGHKISNLTIDTDGAPRDYLGLFGFVSDGTLRNIRLENVRITDGGGSYYLGALAGYTLLGSIRYCNSTGTISSMGTIEGGRSLGIGGLVGSDSGFVSNSFSSCSVYAYAGNDTVSVGGLIGEEYGSLSNSFSTGNVSVGPGSNHIGGLTGIMCWIRNCYATGDVSAGNYSFNIGGLTGEYGGTDLSGCYSTGKIIIEIDGGCVGALVGCGGYTTYDSYFLLGAGPNNGLGTPLTDTQMKQRASFIGWDFTNETANGTNDYWRMCVDGVDYPRLNWESIPGDFACPDGVNMEDLSYFVQRWLLSDCASSNNCGGVDMNTSGTVDMKDYALFASNWLEVI